jgi:predicted anti-sigma-YlaC factor YlaD
MRGLRSQRCERARQTVSAQLDGELSEFEQALLNGHLERCPSCRSFAAELRGLTAALRAAPVEEPEAPLVSLPSRRRLPLRALPVGVAAAAATVAIGLAAVAGSLQTQRPGSLSVNRSPINAREAAELRTLRGVVFQPRRVVTPRSAAGRRIT